VLERAESAIWTAHSYLKSLPSHWALLRCLPQVYLSDSIDWACSNIEGRAEPLNRGRKKNNVIADRALLQRDLRTQGPIVIDAINPWTFVSMRFTKLQGFHRSKRGQCVPSA